MQTTNSLSELKKIAGPLDVAVSRQGGKYILDFCGDVEEFYTFEDAAAAIAQYRNGVA